MLNILDIREGMEVVGSLGFHVGTVDKVEGCEIKLTRSHPKAGASHHWVPLEWVVSVDDAVHLDRDNDQARLEWRMAPESPESPTVQ